MDDNPSVAYTFPRRFARAEEFVTFLRMVDMSGAQTDAAVIQWEYAAYRASPRGQWTVAFNMLVNVQ
jgi:hypothetical protein